MDTSDPEITFDERGECNHCKNYDYLVSLYVRTGETAKKELAAIVDEIKRDGAGKPYDCVIGVSGGVDSTYVAHVVKSLGLRPVAVHMDNGWDSELAVANIEKVLKKLGIDLITEVLDWDEFKDLQLSFLKASVPDGEIPTDHAIAAVMYAIAVRYGIKHLISGSNIVTEGILPQTWTYGVNDWRYIRSVQKMFGTRRLKTFPHFSFARMTYYTSVRRLRPVRILDYVPYVRSEVMRVLQEDLGWKYYGGKHYESIYTRFFQGYILPRKFNIDKRRAHYSTLICSGQMARAKALEEMKNDPYAEGQQAEDREYVIKKLGITERQFDEIMTAPVRSSRDYPTYRPFLEESRRIVKALRLRQILRPIVKPGGL